jgi:hypothetical protein
MSLLVVCDTCQRPMIRTRLSDEIENWVHDYKTGTDCCPECDKKKRDKAFDVFWKKLVDDQIVTVTEHVQKEK